MKNFVHKGGAALVLSLALVLTGCGGNDSGTAHPNQTPVANHAPILQGAPVMPDNVAGNSIGVTPDGKLVVVGHSFVGSSFNDIAVLRYNADGSPDTSFGGGDGIVTTSIGSARAFGYSATFQPDGKLVVAGGVSTNAISDVALLRYNADGSPDASFGGGDGVVITSVGYGVGGYSVVLQPDGKLLVAGEAYGTDILLRYNADGSPDASFGGGDGVVTTPVGYRTGGYGMALQPDGKLVMTGGELSSGGIALLRYNEDGSPDTGFGGGDGIVTMGVISHPAYEGASYNSGLSLTLQPDGTLVVMGEVCFWWGYECFIALLRFNADGSPDTSFGGGDGVLFNEDSPSSYRSNSVTLQPDGKLVVTREDSFYSDYAEIMLLRFNADGSPDSSFGGGDGIVATTLSSVVGLACCFNRTALQPDGKLVVAGKAGSSIALLRYNADGSFDRTFGRNVFDLHEGATFSVPFPTGYIVDPDGDLLSYTARLASGAPLPAWLGFDPATLTFSGTAPTGTAGRNFTIRITATDPGGSSVSDIFSFAVQ